MWSSAYPPPSKPQFCIAQRWFYHSASVNPTQESVHTLMKFTWGCGMKPECWFIHLQWEINLLMEYIFSSSGSHISLYEHYIGSQIKIRLLFDERGIRTTWDNSRNLMFDDVRPSELDASFSAVGVYTATWIEQGFLYYYPFLWFAFTGTVCASHSAIIFPRLPGMSR